MARLLEKDFDYFNIISVIRDPLSQTSSAVGNMGNHKRKSQRRHVLINSSTALIAHAKLMLFGYPHFARADDMLYKKGAIVRFEDLKLNTKATVTALAEHLNIPVTESLLQTTQNGVVCGGFSTRGMVIEDGLSKIPTQHHVNKHDILSERDKYRIEMMHHKYFEHFGYSPKFYDGKEYTLEETLEIMAEPFLCDLRDINEGYLTEEEIARERVRSQAIWAIRYYYPTPPDKTLLPIRMLHPVPELLAEELYR